MQDHMHQPTHHDDGSQAGGTLTSHTAPHAGHHQPAHQHPGDDDHAVHTSGQHAGHSTAMFKNRFWLTLALSVPVVYFSPMVGHILGYMAPMFPGSTWIPPVLGTVIFLYGGQPFLNEDLLNQVLYGVLIIAALLIEPRGLAAVWLRLKAYFRTWPFSY